MNGSCMSFTAALEFPPCQKEDSSGNLVYDEHCDDGMMEASGASYPYNLYAQLQGEKMSCISKGCIYISHIIFSSVQPLCFFSANGQVRSGYVFNWTSWLDDYGFGKCTDLKRCNVFPDGKPFPQTNDWRRRGYVYVWHTMGEFQPFTDPNDISVTTLMYHHPVVFPSQASILRHAMAPPPIWPWTPLTWHLEPVWWKWWFIVNVSAESTARSLRTVLCSS